MVRWLQFGHKFDFQKKSDYDSINPDIATGGFYSKKSEQI